MLFSASPQNTGLRSRGPQTPKRTETVRQLIKPSLPLQDPRPWNELACFLTEASRLPGITSPIPALTVFTATLSSLSGSSPPSTSPPGPLDLSSASSSWSCLSYSLSALWLLLGMSEGSSTTLKQTKQKQEETSKKHRKPFLWPQRPAKCGHTLLP